MMRCWVFGSALCICLGFATAKAQEPSYPEDFVRPMQEPSMFTDVQDAFDGNDRLDLTASFGFGTSSRRGTLARERPGGSTVSVADLRESKVRLDLEFEVGIYKDLAFFARMPLFLSDDREIVGDGSAALSQSIDGASIPVFTTPFASTTRSGLGELSLGIKIGLANQFRKGWQSNWVLLMESKWSFAEVITPCDPALGECANDGGISKGVHTLKLGTHWSRRLGAFEPIAGLNFEVDIRARRAEVLRGTPMQRRAKLQLGVVWITWENVQGWQRLSMTLLAEGQYRSRGYLATPLFDALGTSRSSVLEDGTHPGRTIEEDHLKLGGSLTLALRAARYIRFQVKGSFYAWTPHLLSGVPCGDVSCGDPVVARPGQRLLLSNMRQFSISSAIEALF